MRGHRELIDMRRHGKAPAVVYADCDPYGKAMSESAVALWIEPTDNLQRLDLRCVVGLHVIVNGCDPVRVEEAAQAMRRANAARVQAFTFRPVVDRGVSGFKTTHHTDTQGAYEWHE
jgi:hypothetical protein